MALRGRPASICASALYTLPLLRLDAVLVEIGPVSAFELAGHQFIGHSLNSLRRMVLGPPRSDYSCGVFLIPASTSNSLSPHLVFHLPVFFSPVP